MRPDDPLRLLATAGGADLAAVAGLLVQAARRRTPALLDGVTVLAAALVAREIDSTASGWWYAPHGGGDPANRRRCAPSDSTTVADLGLRLGDGTGALTLLPMLQSTLDLTERAGGG